MRFRGSPKPDVNSERSEAKRNPLSYVHTTAGYASRLRVAHFGGRSEVG